MTLRTSVSLDRELYAPGDTVQASLVLRNEADTAVALHFFTGQRYDFVVIGADTEVWRWSTGRGFVQMMGEERLEAGDSRSWSERFIAPSAPGTYVLEASITSQEPSPSASVELRVGG